MDALTQRWHGWAMRIDALSFRERVLVFVAATGVMLSLMFAGLVEPALKDEEQMLTAISDLQHEIFGLREQLALGERESRSGKNKAIDQLHAEAARLEQAIRDRERGMIAPGKMIEALKSLLAEQPGLTLISLETQAPQPVVKESEGEAAASGAAQPQAVAPAEQRYRHGVELRVQGDYARLTGYVARLENLPWAIHWESLSLDASQHPRLELSLRLSTLSQEPTWARF